MTCPTISLRDAWSRVARDYQRYIQPEFLPAARTLCRAVAIGPADVVLDIACGPATAAIAAREAGAARIVGVDFAREMIGVARQLTRSAGRLHYAVGDALALPFTSACFDAVISSFGLVFAPDPLAAAREAARVLRPAGRLGLLAWPPEGSVGAYQRIVLRYLDAPSGAHDAFQWGGPGPARRWLADFDDVVLEPIEVPFTADSPAVAWRLLRTATGRVASTYEALPAASRERLNEEMESFLAGFRRPDGSILWPREAVVIRAIRR